MPDSYHIIQKQIFDICFSRKDQAFELQTRFSRLFHDQAIAVMEDVFGRLAQVGLPLRLDRLAVDIGTLRYDRIEKDFSVRFKEALEKELERQLLEQAGREAQEWSKSLTGLLEYFLTMGQLPWWGAGDLLADPVAVLQQLLQDDIPGLKGMLVQAGQREEVRRRLVYQFPIPLIRSVVQVLEPEEAVFIFDYQSDIIRIGETRQILRQQMTEFEKNLWVFILTYLLVDRGSYFNRKAFVKSTLGQMARHFNLAYTSLLALLFRALDVYSPALVLRSALPGIIHDLYHEQENEPEKNTLPGDAGRIKKKMDVLREYLVSGSLAGQGAKYDAAALSALFAELIEEAPESTLILLRQLSEQEGIWTRIVGSFDEKVISGLIGLKEPGQKDFIFHYGKKLEVLQREKRLVKTESSGFHQSIWELILSFLWIERGNVFNTRVFLDYTIRRIARRYLLSYQQLLTFLLQGIAQDIRSDKDGSLFHLLAILLKENKEPVDRRVGVEKEGDGALGQGQTGDLGQEQVSEVGQGPASRMERDQPGHMERDQAGRLRPGQAVEPGPVEPGRSRLDILEYWLHHGHYPWWAPQGGEFSPARLWAQLLEEAPRDILSLLQLAGKSNPLLRRLVYQLPVELLLSGIRLLPGGSRAADLYEAMARLPGNPRFSGISQEQVQAVLLLAIWEVYTADDYRDFDATVYMEKSILRLSAEMALSPTLVFWLVQKRIKTGIGQGRLPEQLFDLLRRAGELWEKSELAVVPEKRTVVAEERTVVPEERTVNPGEIAVILGDRIVVPGERAVNPGERTVFPEETEAHSLDSFSWMTEYREEERLQEALSVLAYYLTHRRWPDKWAAMDEEETGQLLKQLLGLLLRKKPGALAALLLEDGNAEARGMVQQVLRTLFRTTALFRSVLVRHDGETLLEQLVTYLDKDEGTGASLSGGPASLSGRSGSLSGRPGSLSGRPGSLSGRPASSPPMDKEAHRAELAAITAELKRKETREKEERRKRDLEKRRAAEDPIYIRNAGLVLLHPLLTHFFRRVGLTEKDQFTSQEAQHRSVHLLQSLVDNKAEHPEYELTLNKILCDVPLEDPVSLSIVLTPEETAVTGELWDVLRQNWEKMKNTSAEAFQVSFLQREGSLIPTQDGWTLRVEQRGIDVLLQYLPWSWGMIKLPWMNKILYVEWV